MQNNSFICLHLGMNTIVLYSFSFTQSIESLLFIGNVLQHDRVVCAGAWDMVRARKINCNRIRVDCGTFKIFY